MFYPLNTHTHTHTHTHTQQFVCVCILSHIQLFCDPMDYGPPGSCLMEFSKQEYLSGLPFPTPEDLPHPGMEPISPESPALAGRFFTTSAAWETKTHHFASSNLKLPIHPSPTPLPLATTNVLFMTILLINLFFGILPCSYLYT